MLAGQALRYSGAFFLLGMLALGLPGARRRPSRREWLRLTALAAVGLVGFNLALIAAVGRATPALVGSVVGAAPVALILAGSLAERRRPRTGALLGACLVCGGVVVAQGGGSASLHGLLLAGVALVSEVSFTLLPRPLLPSLGPLLVSTYACGLAVPMLAGMAAVSAGPDVIVPNGSEAFALVWLMVLTTTIGFLMGYAGVDRLGEARAGLFTGCIPLGALFVSGLTGRGVSAGALVGAALASAGHVVGMAAHPRSPGPPNHQGGAMPIRRELQSQLLSQGPARRILGTSSSSSL